MGGVRENTVRERRGGVSLHGELGFRFGGKHLDLSESVGLRGTAFNEGLRPADAT
jgi:hypothetical protein